MVDEAVFVADLEARHPPLAHVRVFAVGDMDRPPAAELPFVLVVKELEAVQIVQVPLERALLAVDLEGVERLVAAGVPRRLEQAERAVLEVAQEAHASSMPTFFPSCRSGCASAP